MKEEEIKILKKLYCEEFNSVQDRLDYLQNVAKPIVIKYQLYEEASKMRDLEKKLISFI